jgi:DNA-binding response OmpR family regulator
MSQETILVADDDREIVKAIQKLLEMEGYHVLTAYNGLEALEQLIEKEVHLIILDIMMPKLDGLSTMMKIRENKNIPILLLSAKTEESDKVLGLSMGADDYISKPYQPAELVARVKSALRRYLYLGNNRTTTEEKEVNSIENGGLTLNLDEKQIYVDGEPVKLTATEYRIVELLMRNRGRVFSAEEIYERVWKEQAFATENTVMVHIRRIREKIEINPKVPKYLKVVWGIGYKMEKY